MKSTALTCIVGMILLAAVLPIQLVAQDQHRSRWQQTYYVVKDLGTLGGTRGVAESISDRGWVIGDANLSGDRAVHALLWRDGGRTDLGTLGGVNSQEQWPVKDNRGLIVGTAETSATDPFNEDFCAFAGQGVPTTGLICLGFLWRNGVMTPLSTLGGNNSYATGVNNRGEAVGWAENSTQDPTCVPPQVLDFEAVIWGPKAGQIQQLPPLAGDTITAAAGINDREQVIGVSGVCSDPTSHGVLWQHGTVVDLGNLGGVLNTIPWAINSAGYIVGQSDLAGDATMHAFTSTEDEGMQDIGTLPGDFTSLAFGTNEKEQVVGGSCVDAALSNCRAFLWQNGTMTDVNSLVPAGSTPLYLFFGNDINSQGEIAAYAFDQSNGEFHAAVAIPCDREHASDEACSGGAQGRTSSVSDTPPSQTVTLPENVRQLLRRRLRFAAGAFR